MRWQPGRLDTPDTARGSSQLADSITQIRPASQQPVGGYRRLVNGEIRRGYPENRRGTRPAGWVAGGGTVQAAKWFQPIDPSSTEKYAGVMLVIAGDDLYECRAGNPAKLIYADITDSGQACEIIPAATVCLILRGLDQDPVVYDPYGLTMKKSGVNALPTANPGKVQLPASSTGTYAANRFWLKYGTDQLIASDLLEFDYDVANVFTAESSGNGQIVRVWPYADDSLLVFKDDLVVQMTGIHDTDSMVARRVYGAQGCIAPRSIAQDGDMLFYLSARGVEVLRLGTDGQMVLTGPEFSASMARSVDAIIEEHAEEAVGVVHDGYYLLTVPSTATRTALDYIGWQTNQTIAVPSDQGGLWRPGNARGLLVPFNIPIWITES